MNFHPSTRVVRSLLVAFALMMLSAASFGQVSIYVNFAPPALPIYEQPVCPDDGFLWVPGYWAFADDDYYWVPGTWVQPPEAGLLWTPPYWGWDGERYDFYDGYWGPTVGFYGGIAYGFGYFGEGYEGGRWDHDRFFYNREVNNVNVTNIHNVYNQTVTNNTTINRVSYNGGNGGVTARPRPQDEAASHERHVPPVAAQVQHIQAARSNPELKATANQGKPPVAATAKPGEFRAGNVVPAKQAGAPYNPPANRGAAQRENRAAQPQDRPPVANDNSRSTPGIHPKDMPPHPRLDAPNTGNAKQDAKYQQQQQKLYAKQEQDHQKLQQKQDQEHQRLEQQKADQARTQQVEQRHQQQTQQMEQRHAQQIQKLQERQPQGNRRPPSGQRQ